MIGFETIGNATVTAIDNDRPVLTTDPWIYGKPYFNSWDHSYTLPLEQVNNIKESKYVWISHGHPDHLDNDTLNYFKKNGTTLLLPDHYGNRIYDDLKSFYNCIKLKSNTWFEVSKNVRIISFADWNQDATLIIEILKKDYVLNLNDGYARGWSSTIKRIIKNAKNSFLLRGIGWAPADMINLYDESGRFIEPNAVNRTDLGPIYSASQKNWGCNYAIPFSAFHIMSREDNVHMAKYETPLSAHKIGFKSNNGDLLPAFIRWDSTSNDYSQIKVKKNKPKLISPDEIGDSWSDELTTADKNLLLNYFNKIEHLKLYFGYLIFIVGKKEFTIKLSKLNTGVVFEVPRNSLITAINYQIFDDLLIGNFMKTTLINIKSLYPDFSPYVAKYADNGFANSLSELEIYFNHYKVNSVDYWRDMFISKSEDIFRRNISINNPIWNTAKYIKDYYI
tara:strand:- start:406 stop:1752 length:1347 start_codon:yes stop_codon:yes gene_type:complete